MKKFQAGPNELGMRLSRFVEHVTQDLPPSLMYKSFRNKRIKVNGKKAAPDYLIQKNDEIELYINDEFFEEAAPTLQVPPEDLPPCDILFEDENIALLFKPRGLLCHKDEKKEANLLDAFTWYLTQSGHYTPQGENTFAPALCNRLDQGTEGIVIAAKNAQSLRDMNTIIRQDQLAKIYLCVCQGQPKPGLYTAWHDRDKIKKVVRVQAEAFAGSKQIITEIAQVENLGPISLCQIVLHTGRTHQIRAHLAFLGHPILGDKKYGDKAINQQHGLHTQLLCAWKIQFAGTLDAQSRLAYLSARSFEAEHSFLQDWIRAYKNRTGKSHSV